MGSFIHPRFLIVFAILKQDSKIKIGANTHINNGFTAIAENKSIIIGSMCLIGPNVNIFNSDFHPVHPGSRRIKEPVISEGIIIGDNVFIGANVTILKGVKIGSGATIAAGAIVCKDVGQDTLVGGNPAQVLKLLRLN